MNKITLGVTTVAFSKNEELVNRLNNSGFGRVKSNIAGKRFTRLQLLSFLSDCDAAIVGLDKIDHELLEDLPRLKVISKYGVGLDNIDLEACKDRGVSVLHSQGVNKRSVSEMALGFMLSLCRNLYITSNQLKNGNWNKNGGFLLSEKTIGIIGVGHVGKDLIQLLKPFNCKILVNDIIDQKQYYKEHGLIESTKKVIFNDADIISVHTPLNNETRNLFSSEVFNEMKNSSILINTARGGIVNQIDLKTAIKSGQIAGAAIDAYEIEPPEDTELIELPNLINTPHIGGNAFEAVQAMGDAAIKNIVEYYN